MNYASLIWTGLPFGRGMSGHIARIGMKGFGLSSPEISRDQFGAKATYLAKMAECDLPVPPALAIAIAKMDQENGAEPQVDSSFMDGLERGLKAIGRETETRISAVENPLLVAVRTSPVEPIGGLEAPFLEIGWTIEALEAIEDQSEQQRAAKAHAIIIHNLATGALKADAEPFEDLLEAEELKEKPDWLLLCHKLWVLASELCALPRDPLEQIVLAVEHHWASWNSTRSITYRQLYDIPDTGGLGVLVQAIARVTGAESDGSGWVTRRDDDTGEVAIKGSFSPQKGYSSVDWQEFADSTAPEIAATFVNKLEQLEVATKKSYRIEFIVRGENFYVIDAAPLVLKTGAAVSFAVDLANRGVITREEAVRSVDPATLIDVLHATIEDDQGTESIAQGIAASPGAASGALVFNAAEAEALGSKGRNVVLVRAETSPEDVRGMQSAVAIVTNKGGMTSHAAVIARGIGKPCVVSLTDARIDAANKILRIGKKKLGPNDIVTVDGTSGAIYPGVLPLRPSDVSGDLRTLLSWADDIRRMKIFANVETASDAALAARFGAEGIGLCRTEHMLFEPGRLNAMRRLILSNDDRKRIRAFSELVPVLRDDFIAIFRIMGDRPVTIRLFDPPLHEFLPKDEPEIADLAEVLGLPADELRDQISALNEVNPMLGNRGCRLLICNPEITETLSRVILQAAITVSNEIGVMVKPEIMVPLVAMSREFTFMRQMIENAAEAVAKEAGRKVDFKVGSMIELPRAALVAHRIAEQADFFSFGTNDLTQTTFGISRDDAVAFLPTYENMGVMDRDPFVSIDEEGVGAVIEIATKRGREANEKLAVGICGEHGGDPSSIDLCERLGIDYVSCSPFRLPIARLAAAQATLRNRA